MSAHDHLSGEQFQHVPMEKLPVASWTPWAGEPTPHAVSPQDNPNEYASMFEGVKSFSLKQVPVDSLHTHVHDARCYVPGNPHEHLHDVDPEGGDDELVRDMAKDVDRLPALVQHPSGGYFGGGHRSAAFREAGRTHIPMWVPDGDQ